MKVSFVAPLGCLTLVSLLAAAPAAEAKAAGLCTVSGTINFTPSAAPQGRWDISPGVIECRGFFFGWSPMLGSGSFVASGSYTAVPSDAGCVEQLGPGTVDYWIMTTDQHVHLVEPHSFTLAGAGAFTTPTLRGTFQIPLYDGNCMNTPRTTTLFLAQVTLARAGPPPIAADVTLGGRQSSAIAVCEMGQLLGDPRSRVYRGRCQPAATVQL